MFDRTPPPPIVVEKAVPNCLKGVTKHTVLYWGGMWQIRAFSEKLYCQYGKREVSLTNPIDCKDCQFNSLNRERLG